MNVHSNSLANRRFIEAAKLTAEQTETRAVAERSAVIAESVSAVLLASTGATHAGPDQTAHADALNAAKRVADLDATIARAQAEQTAADALLTAFDAALA